MGLDGGAGVGQRRAVLSGRGSNYSYKSRVKGPLAVLHVLPLISSVLLVSSLREADASEKMGVCEQLVLKEFCLQLGAQFCAFSPENPRLRIRGSP